MAAAPVSIDGNRITLAPSAHSRSKRCHPSGIFMSQGERAGNTDPMIEYVKVGVANSGTTDLDQNFPGTGPGRFDFNDFGAFARLDKSNRFHL